MKAGHDIDQARSGLAPGPDVGDVPLLSKAFKLPFLVPNSLPPHSRTVRSSTHAALPALLEAHLMPPSHGPVLPVLLALVS